MVLEAETEHITYIPTTTYIEINPDLDTAVAIKYPEMPISLNYEWQLSEKVIICFETVIDKV